MTKWEYTCVTLQAHIDVNGVKEYINTVYPSWEPPMHHVKTIEAQLQKWGDNGWELMHIEPVDMVGKNGDLGYQFDQVYGWRRHFFCVFKRA